MTVNPDFLSPCGLYCGVCAIHIAFRDNNQKFKESLVGLYKGKVLGKVAISWLGVRETLVVSHANNDGIHKSQHSWTLTSKDVISTTVRIRAVGISNSDCGGIF